jgi:phosphate acetyltransferase
MLSRVFDDSSLYPRIAIIYPIHPIVLDPLNNMPQGVDYFLIGPENKIREHLKAPIKKERIIDASSIDDAVRIAIQLFDQGRIDAIQKGHVSTHEFLQPLVRSISKPCQRMSHLYVIQLPLYHKPIIITDSVMHITPSLDHKIHIVQNAIDFWDLFEKNPAKIAVLSAVGGVSLTMPSTLDGAILCKMFDLSAHIDTLSLDLALSQSSKETKGSSSLVSGDADILIMPDLNAANILMKCMLFMANGQGAGLVVGGRIPLILTSRSTGVTGRLFSYSLAYQYVERLRCLS